MVMGPERSNSSSPAISRDLQFRSKQLAERFSEALHVLDHDPSMALYRLHEHVGKVVPKLVVRKHQMGQLNTDIQGACFDLDNAIQTLEQMRHTQPTFERIQQTLKEAVQQMERQRQRRSNNKDKDPPNSAKGTCDTAKKTNP